MRIKIIRADGTFEVRDVRCRSGYIEDIHRIVDPILDTKHLEHVNVFTRFGTEPDRYIDAFVDEDGLEKRLPVNRRATEIYQNNVRVHDPKNYDPARMPFIVGTMILFEERVWL